MAKRAVLPEDAYQRGKKTLRPLQVRATRTLPLQSRTNAQIAALRNTEKDQGFVPLELSLRLRKRSMSGASHYLMFASDRDARQFCQDLCQWIKCKAAVYVEQERKGCVKHRDAFLGPLND